MCREGDSPRAMSMCPFFSGGNLLLCTWELCSLLQCVNKQVIRLVLSFWAKGKNFIILGNLFSHGQAFFFFFNFFTCCVAVSALKAGVKLKYDHMPCVKSIFKTAIPGEMRRACLYCMGICNVSFFITKYKYPLQGGTFSYFRQMSISLVLFGVHAQAVRQKESDSAHHSEEHNPERLQEMSWAECRQEQGCALSWEYQSFSSSSGHMRKPQKRKKLW